MRLLLDTHLFLWSITDSRRLARVVRGRITTASEVYVSAASIWEIAIKVGLGKLDADPAEVEAAIDRSGFIELSVTSEHAARVAALPLHHHDPFDRLLVAQAVSEPLVLLTADQALASYGAMVQVV
jgi:PIN domain nuclease of toxin-antitoxin system